MKSFLILGYQHVLKLMAEGWNVTLQETGL
jgi:hypothetical protein